MKKAYVIDNEGFYINDYFHEEGQELDNNIVTVEYTQGLYKPKWNGTEWVEGATQEYIDSLKASTISEPTLEERVATVEDTINFLLGM